MLDYVRRARRSARVVRTGARIYFRYKRIQQRMRGKPQKIADAAWLNAHEQAAQELYQLTVDLKGLLIKVGQFAGTRSDIAPAPYVESLSRLQDMVPPRDLDEIQRTITTELGRGTGELFATFDETPLAAASLAQVHHATLKDGTPVAVKVQYPEVDSLVHLDLRNLRLIARAIAWREPTFDYRAIIDELARELPFEVDFVREAAMTRRVAHNLRDTPGIVVPPVVDSLVSRRVLVTRFLEGERVIGPRAQAMPPAQREELARRIAGAFGHQIMVDGLFQADPHPGNLILMPNGDVGLVDFGLTKELPRETRDGFARLVIAAAERDPAGIFAAFRELGIRTGSDDPADLMALAGVFFETRTLEGGRQEFQRQRSQALQRSPVEAIPGDLILLGRVVGLLRGVCASLGVPLSPMGMLRPYAEQALRTQAETGTAAPATG